MSRYTHFFTGTDVPTFRVPQSLIGDTQEKGILVDLSHPALRLYLTLLCKCSRENKPIVKMSSEYIERHADIGEKHISKYRTELEYADLVGATKKSGEWFYEVLQPNSNGCPLDIETPESTPRISKKGRLDLNPDQIRLLFMHYLGDSFVMDDANGMQFRCPFHMPIGDAKRSRISVGLESGGPWMCHWHQCRRNGKRRVRDDQWGSDGVLDLEQELAHDGGGNALDFIVAMTEYEENKVIGRKEAEVKLKDILAGLIKRKQKPFEVPDDMFPPVEGVTI
jgi:hypothetical protein